MRTPRPIMWLLLLALGFPLRSDPPEVLGQAKRLYASRNYDSTVILLKAYVKAHGKDSANEYVVPLLVEALLRKNQIAYAERLGTIYKRKFPQSPFIPRMHYLEGVIHARRERYTEAVASFSVAMGAGMSPTLDSLAIANVRTMCEAALTTRELASLSKKKAVHRRIREVLKYYEISKSYDAGEIRKVAKSTEEFDKEFPRSAYSSKTKSMASSARSRKNEQIQIGLLAPLSGYDADIGKKIVRGAQAAIEQHNALREPKINLIIGDTRGSAVETARRTLAMVNEHRVSLIIGPILSHNAVVTASLLLDKDVLMISPTATDDGIAELGPYIFQMNVSLGSLGRQIAEYAMNNLNIKEFAIMSPMSEYGMTLSRRFREYVEGHGGQIVTQELFDEGANDYRPQHGQIHRTQSCSSGICGQSARMEMVIGACLPDR